MNFQDAFTSTYCDNPCQLLPNALWKTLRELEDLQTFIGTEKNRIVNMQAWNETSLMVYWTRNRKQPFEFDQPQLNLNFALIHQDYLPTFPFENFTVQKSYFRLLFRKTALQRKVSIPGGFSFVEVNIRQELQQVSRFIKKCYQESQTTVESVMSWCKHPTFDPTLWVWVVDNLKNIPLGLGIAEIDNDIREGSLEWIQVLPEYRGRGIGKSIVRELLSRLEPRTNFTTVAGEVNNPTNPEALYRSCGFKGSDIWWVFRV